MDIESFATTLEGIPPASGMAWRFETVIAGRVYLSRSTDNRPTIFLEGSKDSFGHLPCSDDIGHSDSVVSLPSGRHLQALRISTTDSINSHRVLAHIAYELHWRLATTPSTSNAELVRSVEWLFKLLGGRTDPMPMERQIGFVGESLFLRRLMHRALAREIPVKFAVDCWAGADSSKRDFYSKGVAVEVKTTRSPARLHHIGSINQLDAQEVGECVYLYSVGIQADATAPKKLTHFVVDLENLCLTKDGAQDESVLRQLRDKLFSYGFDWSDSDQYLTQPGFLAPHLRPEIFDVSTLRRLTLDDFVDAKIPETVRSVSYSLEVVGTPLSDQAMLGVCDALLGHEHSP